MRITDYTAVSQLDESDVLLLDGTNGTRTIKAIDAIMAALHTLSPENHRRIFRGKNLGTSVTTAQLAAIQAGTFEDLWVGDYWVINGVTWRIADFDYWYNCGDTPLSKHHIVLIPDDPLYSAVMNSTSVTTGGYISSAMYGTNLAEAKNTVTGAFSSMVLSHREFLINEVTSGYPSAGSWYDSEVELPNEPMMYGCYINTPSEVGAKLHTISKVQLALFAVAPRYILASSQSACWLRDIASATAFACVNSTGAAHLMNAANSAGVRPVFAIG